MSDDKAQQEPSMEDILASIRRILSEDEAEEQVKAPMPEPEPEPEPEPAPLPQDDIDALFAMAAPAPEPEPEPEPVFEPEPLVLSEPEDDDDILELTDDMVLDEPEPEPAFDIDDFSPDTGGFEFEDIPEPVVMPLRATSKAPVDDDTLVSRPVADRSTSLLSDLAREIVRARAIGIGNGGITLEDMVRELLKPILKEWLDENLPYMIERIVKKEIEKMVNRAENL